MKPLLPKSKFKKSKTSPSFLKQMSVLVLAFFVLFGVMNGNAQVQITPKGFPNAYGGCQYPNGGNSNGTCTNQGTGLLGGGYEEVGDVYTNCNRTANNAESLCGTLQSIGTTPNGKRYNFGSEKCTGTGTNVQCIEGGIVFKQCEQTSTTYTCSTRALATAANTSPSNTTGPNTTPTNPGGGQTGPGTTPTTPTNPSAGNPISDGASAAAAVASSNPQIQLLLALINLVLSIIILIIWAVGWVLGTFLWLMGAGIVTILQINPAGGFFASVAVKPWGVVQGVANLVVLASFLFVGFAYILNIKQYKTRIDQFLTNIVIIAVLVNVTLTLSQSVVNISQGVGAVFINSYAAVKGEPAERALISSTLNSFKSVSALRCGNIPTTTSATTSGAPASGTPATPAAGNNSDCKASNEGSDTANIGKAFSGLFTGKIDTTIITLLKESIYLLIVIFGIYAFFRVLFLVITRLFGLWMLMVLSPLALAAQFSPDGFGLKSWGAKWLKSFFNLTVFYPAFVFGLVLIQELTGAFTEAANKVADIGGQSAQQALGGENVVLTILAAGVAIAALEGLVKFFEGAFKEIMEAVAKAGGGLLELGRAAATSVAVGSRWGAKGIAAVGDTVPGLKGLRAKATAFSGQASQAASALDEKILTEKSYLKRLALQGASGILKGTSGAAAGAGTGGAFGLGRFANFTEMLPEYIEDAGKIGKTIGSKWAKQRKARVSSFKAGDNLRQELFLRQNPQIAALLGIDPDELENAQLRGLDDIELRRLEAQNPGWSKKKTEETVKRVYAQTMGSDKKIIREIGLARLEAIAKAASGDFSKLSGKDRDLFLDIIDENIGDAGFMSQIAANSNALNAVRGAYAEGGALKNETMKAMREKSPIFLAKEEERREAVANISPRDLNDIARYNLADKDVQAAMISRLGPTEALKMFSNNGYVESAERQALQQKTQTENFDSGEKARLEAGSMARSQSSFTGESALVAQVSKTVRASSNPSDSVIRGYVQTDLVTLKTKEFGTTAGIQTILGDTSMTEQNKIDAISAQSTVARAYVAQHGGSGNVTAREVAANTDIARQSFESNEGAYIERVLATSKQGAKALEQRDLSIATHQRQQETFKKAANDVQTGAVDFSSLSANPVYLQEVGIQPAIENIVNNVKRSGTATIGAIDVSAPLQEIVVNGREQDFQNHMARVTNAAIEHQKVPSAVSSASYTQAIDEMEREFGDITNFNSVVAASFDRTAGLSPQLAGDYYSEGQKQHTKDKNIIENNMRRNNTDPATVTPDIYRAYAVDHLNAKQEKAKQSRKDAVNSSQENFKRLNTGNANAVFSLFPEQVIT
jgi:hypothetical protein